MVIGGIFQADQTRPAHTIPKRRAYMMEDLRRLSEWYGIPYHERTTFLFNPILAMRATIQVAQGAERSKVVHSLYRGVWVEDRDLGDPETVKELLDRAGMDGDALVTGAQQQSVKDQLRTNTEEALSMGVFGAPTFFLNGDKMFWGHDRLKLLDYFLGKSEK
jgi:2-hydroxychromene-2-carboxylate isomerase